MPDTLPITPDLVELPPSSEAAIGSLDDLFAFVGAQARRAVELAPAMAAEVEYLWARLVKHVADGNAAAVHRNRAAIEAALARLSTLYARSPRPASPSSSPAPTP